MIAFLLFFLLACQPLETRLTWSAAPNGIVLHDANGVPPVVVHGADGAVLLSESNKGQLTTIWMPIDWSQNERVFVRSRGSSASSPAEIPRPTTQETVQVSIPLGQDSQALPADGILQYVAMSEAEVGIGISLVVMESGSIEIKLGETSYTISNARQGQRINWMGTATTGQSVEIVMPASTWSGMLERQEMSIEEVQSELAIESIQFPVDSFGNPDVARPSGKIALPAQWWSTVMAKMGWGVRARDRTVSWGHVAVRIRNRGQAPMNLVVRARVANSDGPDPVFRPTMRDVDDGTGWVSVGLRARANAVSTIALPLYVHEGLLSEDNRNRQDRNLDVQISPTGSTDTVAEGTLPLFVNRGSTPAAVGFALGVMGSFGGLVLIVARIRRWLGMNTLTLVTIALFATLSFVVNAAVQVVGFGFASLLGPFAFLVTGLLDDTVRACLLATLLLLRPHPGVCALSVLVGWMLRSVVLGSASPTDLLYLTGHVFFLEASLWLFGLTRGKLLTFLRLGLSFVVTYSLTILTALAFNVVLYRLYYADWYIGLSVFANGIVFPLLACGIAIPFAKTLKRVED